MASCLMRPQNPYVHYNQRGWFKMAERQTNYSIISHVKSSRNFITQLNRFYFKILMSLLMEGWVIDYENKSLVEKDNIFF